MKKVMMKKKHKSHCFEKLKKELGDLNRYTYFGGRSGSHLKYYIKTLRQKKEDMPKREKACICETPIVINCFVKNMDTKELFVIGKDCIKRFFKHKNRTCENCRIAHKNRSVNLCNTCKLICCKRCYTKLEKGLCVPCGKEEQRRYEICLRNTKIANNIEMKMKYGRYIPYMFDSVRYFSKRFGCYNLKSKEFRESLKSRFIKRKNFSDKQLFYYNKMFSHIRNI